MNKAILIILLALIALSIKVLSSSPYEINYIYPFDEDTGNITWNGSRNMANYTSALSGGWTDIPYGADFYYTDLGNGNVVLRSLIGADHYYANATYYAEYLDVTFHDDAADESLYLVVGAGRSRLFVGVVTSASETFYSYYVGGVWTPSTIPRVTGDRLIRFYFNASDSTIYAYMNNTYITKRSMAEFGWKGINETEIQASIDSGYYCPNCWFDNFYLYNYSNYIPPLGVFPCNITYSTPTLTINFLNVSDNSPINASIEYNLNFISGYTYSTFADSLINNTLLICIYPNITYTTTIMLDYSWGGMTYSYQEIWTLTNDNQTQDIYIGGQEEGQTTTQAAFTLYDTTNNKINGAYIKILQYNLGSNSFLLTESLLTNVNGQVFANIILNTMWYKIIVEYNGQIYLETSPMKITSTTNTLIINLMGDYMSNYKIVNNIAGRLSWNNDTKCWYFTYNDPSSSISSGCIEINVEKIIGTVAVNNTCSASTSGTIYSCINETGTWTFFANGYAVLDGVKYIIDIDSVSFNYLSKTYGKTGIFAAFAIIITAMAIGFYNPVASIFLMLLGFSVSVWLNLLQMSWMYLIGFICLGAIVIYKINRVQ